jgi:glucosyl-3-phosphoglycerate synthase
VIATPRTPIILGNMVSVLIPAFNESDRIADTIKAVRQIASTDRLEIIVVDDGSFDTTAEAAQTAGGDIVLRQRNAGKGAALRTAVQRASGEILVLLDADLGATAAEAHKLLAPILAGEADMTIATFPIRPGRGGGAGLVVRLARWGIRVLTGRTMTTPLSGQRALRRVTLDSSGGFASGWGVEIALTIRALWSGCRVIEVATEMDHRVTGRSAAAILHRAAQFTAVVRVLFGLWLWRRRDGGRKARAGNRDG